MAYRYDNYDQSIVIEGFENGIADSPYLGISDLKNVNIVSVPGEASVGFSTAKISPPVVGNTIIDSLNANVLGVTGGVVGLENGMAISFSSVGGLTGVSTNTAYWVFQGTGTPMASFRLYSDYEQTQGVSIGGAATGSPTFSSFNVAIPKHFTKDTVSGFYWMVDSSGQVWSNSKTTPTNGYWTYTGNNNNPSGSNGTGANGNGLVFLQTSDSGANIKGYVFTFRNSRIDYAQTSGTTTITWIYGWNPSNGLTGQTTNYLKTLVGTNNSHEAFLAPDSRVYFCDANWIGRFYQTDQATAFNPTNTATFTYDQTQLLPTTDIAQCLAFLGTNILVGGINNIIYPWDRFDSNFNYPILLSESNIVKMVTVNTNTYIFTGNRGRIYITNGSQAQLYKKVPDHISNTVEPYFTWGGAVTNKNQLYFSLKATDNAGNANNNYGGVWAIDLNNGAIRLTNQLSYGTYAGYATALIMRSGTPAGAGLFIGWDSGASTYGIDQTSSTPYTSGAGTTTIESDLIPIGTFEKPRDGQRIEYKLNKPLVSGESITLKYRTDFSQNWTNIFTDSTAGNFSQSSAINWKNAQWIQIQAAMYSTGTTPSYVRLKEIRISGLGK